MSIMSIRGPKRRVVMQQEIIRGFIKLTLECNHQIVMLMTPLKVKALACAKCDRRPPIKG